MGSYRYRSLIEGLYTFNLMTDDFKAKVIAERRIGRRKLLQSLSGSGQVIERFWGLRLLP